MTHGRVLFRLAAATSAAGVVANGVAYVNAGHQWFNVAAGAANVAVFAAVLLIRYAS